MNSQLITHQKLKFDNLAFYGACIYAFLIPFNQKVATFGILIWVIFSILNYNKNKFNKSSYLMLLPFFYLVYIVSLFYSENQGFGYLEHKLSLLAFPLVFFLRKYDNQEKKTIAKYFIFGLFIASVIYLFLALFKSVQYNEGIFAFKPNLEEGRGFYESSIYGGNYFFGQNFSVFHQTVYFSIYLCTGIAMLIFDNNPNKSNYRAGLVLFFLVILFLISNKAGFLIISIMFFIRLFSLKLLIGTKLSIMVVGLFVLGLIVYLNPRYQNSFNKIAKGEIGIDGNARYDYKIRLLSWDAAIELIKEEPLWGYGVGDSQNVLNKTYKEKGYKAPLKKAHNAHNQFLQTWIESGLLGLFWVIIIFSFILIITLKDRSQRAFLTSIFVILLVSAMFESIFNRFSGISFFSFIVCLFYFESKNK